MHTASLCALKGRFTLTRLRGEFPAKKKAQAHFSRFRYLELQSLSAPSNLAHRVTLA